MIRKSVVFLCFIALILSACERDDICAVSTPTTPQLVIQFYNVDNRTEAKIINLQAVEVNNTDVLTFTNDTLIKLPLRTNVEQTQYYITKNPGVTEGDEPENTDIITFDYLTNEVYISRACGFRVTYDDLAATTTNGEDGRWIEDIEINSEIVVDENTTHVNIYH